MPNYWMLTTTPENYRITERAGFTQQGFRSRNRRKAQRMQPGDRILYYLKFVLAFPAIVTITSTYWESEEPLWLPETSNELHPYRVYIQPDIVLEAEEFIDARELAPTLQYVKRWAPEDWPLAFQDDLHLIPKRDFFLVESEMKKLLEAKKKAPLRR